MSAHTQVVFRFANNTEVRYVDRVPECGDRIARDGTEWEVVAIETPQEGITTCLLAPLSVRTEEATPASDLLEQLQALELDRRAWNLPRGPDDHLNVPESAVVPASRTNAH